MGGSGFQKEKSMCEGPKARKILYAQRSDRGEARHICRIKERWCQMTLEK